MDKAAEQLLNQTDKYDICTLPTPIISKPDEILIKVHAASINPIDVKTAGGMTKLLKTEKYAYVALQY